MDATRSAPSLGGRVLLLLALQCVVILAVVTVATVVAIGVQQRGIREATIVRVTDVAESLAALDEVRNALAEDREAATARLQPLADIVQRASGVDYVVVMDTSGIRVTHPDPDARGERVSTDPTGVLAGEEYLGTEDGTLGPTLRAKVPVRDGDVVIGAVSVGILEDRIAGDTEAGMWGLLPWVIASVIAACGVSAALTGLIRRRVTRLEAANREAEAERVVTQALRDQAHEFHTRLHVVRGLVDAGDQVAALDYIETLAPVTHASDTPPTIAHVGARAVLDSAASALDARGGALVVAPTSAAAEDALTEADVLVLSNLVRNAVDAATRRVHVAIHADATHVAIDVGDDGPGLSPDQAVRVFDRGYSEKGDGRGIGLDLVRRAVGARGGTIEVGTSTDGGALFSVEMPAESWAARR
ncbi:sensor histidine kinase [Microbacterium dauci]|uniref:histidine kinase n=1 Tax=Microbacterium dauci TaxID=3048008 RepID=A0ABT6ZH18_9MICO|nr:ATP-binding protein [Microbacterium sp. LX3-4]MDJ1115451.1 ATP-binding protein [Microbacterium sp. LX3-4]